MTRAILTKEAQKIIDRITNELVKHPVTIDFLPPPIVQFSQYRHIDYREGFIAFCQGYLVKLNTNIIDDSMAIAFCNVFISNILAKMRDEINLNVIPYDEYCILNIIHDLTDVSIRDLCLIGSRIRLIVEMHRLDREWLPTQFITETEFMTIKLGEDDLKSIQRYIGDGKIIYVKLFLFCASELIHHDDYLNKKQLDIDICIEMFRSSWFLLLLTTDCYKRKRKFQ